MVYRVVVQLGQAACRSEGLRWYGRGGLTARRAEAVVIVTRQGQGRASGLGRLRDRARAAPGGTAHNRLSTPQRLLRRNLVHGTHETSEPHHGRARRARRDARRSGRERADCEDDAERFDMAERCGGPKLPARSRLSAYGRLRRLKGARPAEPDALAALDPTPAAGDDQRQVAGVRKAYRRTSRGCSGGSERDGLGREVADDGSRIGH